MNFDEAFEIVLPLVAGPRDGTGKLEPAYSQLIETHFARRAFFASQARSLKNRTAQLHKWLSEQAGNHPHIGSRHRPHEKVAANAAALKEETLSSLARLQNVLTFIRDHGDTAAKAITKIGVPQDGKDATYFTIPERSITPSFYVAHRKAIESSRTKLQKPQLVVSREVFGPHAPNIFQTLENGDRGHDVAVSFAFKDKVESWFRAQDIDELLFEADPQRLSYVLPPSRGNIVRGYNEP